MTNKYEFWNNDVEEAILKYIVCSDIKKKNEIFNKYILIAFKKLINIVIKESYSNIKDYCDKEIKDDLLYELVVKIQKYNNQKYNIRIYCETILRSSILDYKHKSFREKQNIPFLVSHEVLLNKLNY
jgi:hypothetical protein